MPLRPLSFAPCRVAIRVAIPRAPAGRRSRPQQTGRPGKLAPGRLWLNQGGGDILDGAGDGAGDGEGGEVGGRGLHHRDDVVGMGGGEAGPNARSISWPASSSRLMGQGSGSIHRCWRSASSAKAARTARSISQSHPQ